MSAPVSRYGNKTLTYALVKSAPRMVALTAVGAIVAECVGNGFIDFVWGSLNSGKQWDDLYKQIKRRQAAENPAADMSAQTSLKRNVA